MRSKVRPELSFTPKQKQNHRKIFVTESFLWFFIRDITIKNITNKILLSETEPNPCKKIMSN